MSKKLLMTSKDVARIKSVTSKSNNGVIPKKSFAARAESVVAKRNDKGNTGKQK